MKKCIVFIIFALNMNNLSCFLPSGRLNMPPAGVRSDWSIAVEAKDPLVAETICDALQKIHYFREVYCLQRLPLKQRATFDYILQVDTRIRHVSQDILRNLEFSLKTLTMGLQVSTSGVVVYDFRLYDRQRKPLDGRFRGEGRIGMWTVLPLYTGLIGSSLGAALNSYRLPDSLRKTCLENKGADAGYETDACNEYREFINNSFSKIRVDFRRYLLEGTISGNRGNRV